MVHTALDSCRRDGTAGLALERRGRYFGDVEPASAFQCRWLNPNEEVVDKYPTPSRQYSSFQGRWLRLWRDLVGIGRGAVADGSAGCRSAPKWELTTWSWAKISATGSNFREEANAADRKLFRPSPAVLAPNIEDLIPRRNPRRLRSSFFDIGTLRGHLRAMSWSSAGLHFGRRRTKWTSTTSRWGRGQQASTRPVMSTRSLQWGCARAADTPRKRPRP